MTIKSVFLFAPTEFGESDRGPAAYAISMAKAHKAHLEIFTVVLDVTTPGLETDPVATASALRSAAEAAGLGCTLVTGHSHSLGVHEVIAEHARLHDLAVMGCDGSGILSERQITEYLLFESGRPVIVVPKAYAAPYRRGSVAAGWDNTAAAARALGDTLALFGPDHVHLLTISGEKPLPTDLDTNALAQAVERRAASADHSMVLLGPRTIAVALQEEAERRGAALLCMGAYGHTRFRRFVFGSATADVLRCNGMPTLLSH